MKNNHKLIIGSSTKMDKIKDNSIDLIITSPPYFNIKDYSMDGRQKFKHSKKEIKDIGNFKKFEKYIKNMLKVWKECFRVLKPNGKLCINVPLLPIKKNFLNGNNRHIRQIYDLQSEIQNSILKKTSFYLLDLYIWNRTNSTKKLMFGSYPYPGNFYAQNTIEFITIYVKDGSPKKRLKKEKEKSKLNKEEWVNYTKQIWNIAIPNKKDKAFGKHSAIMPEEIPKRLIKLFSFKNDLILDPFAGSGTTLKVAKDLKRNSIGYEIYENYIDVVQKKVGEINVEK